MPSLEEIRDRFSVPDKIREKELKRGIDYLFQQGGDIDLSKLLDWGYSVSELSIISLAIEAKIDNRKFIITKNGTDAILLFGKYRGSSIRELSTIDSNYLVWLTKQKDFDQRITEIITKYTNS